jgi:hypothetical protein
MWNELKEILLDKLRIAPASAITEGVATGVSFAFILGLFLVVIFALYFQSCHC